MSNPGFEPAPLALLTAPVTTIPRRVWRSRIIGKKTIRWLMERYRQPDHCTYPEALRGLMGCWSLVFDPWKCTPRYCKTCDDFRIGARP